METLTSAKSGVFLPVISRIYYYLHRRSDYATICEEVRTIAQFVYDREDNSLVGAN